LRPVLDRRRVLATHYVVRPETFGFIELALIDVNAVTSRPCARRTSRPCAQPADADDAHPIGRQRMASGAKTVTPPHRSGPASVQLSGSGMAQASARGCGSRIRRDGRRWLPGLQAQVMASRHAVTVHAASASSADTDACPTLSPWHSDLRR
jgi:hypothetical protein